MKWLDRLEILKLYLLEERLIFQRILFMQIRELFRGGQMFVKGNVVNVFVDIQLIVNVFFRQLDEYVIIVVKLKKRFFYKFVCFFENVCFNKVMNVL